MIEENASAQRLFNQNLNSLLVAAENILIDDITIELGSISRYNTIYSPEDEHFIVGDEYSKDWWYTLGTADGWMTAIVTKTDNNFSAFVNYYLRDFYDWEAGSQSRGGLVDDGEMAELHTYGLAKEFEIEGNYKIKLEWTKGQRIDFGVVINDWTE